MHHESSAIHAPGVWRLHMVGEPELAPNVVPAPFAHARIDRWAEAGSWLADVFGRGMVADSEAKPASCSRDGFPPCAYRSREFQTIYCGFGMSSAEHTSDLKSLLRSSYAVFCLKYTIINYTC